MPAPQLDSPPQEFVIDTTNHAEDPTVSKRALEFVTGLVHSARSDRNGWNETLKQLYNIWDCTTDVRWYTGRADVYFPAGHRAVERFVSKVNARLFPTGDDFIDVTAMPPGDANLPEIASNLESVKALIWYDLTQVIRIRARVQEWLRQLAVTGTSPWASDYVTQEEVDGWTHRNQARLVQDPRLGLVGQPLRLQEAVGPRGRPVDLFTWYAHPTTISKLEDALIVFEDNLVTANYLKRWRAHGRYAFTDEQLAHAKGSAQVQDSIWNSARRMEQREALSGEDDSYILTTAYALFDPQAEDQDKSKEAIPFQFALLNDDLCIMARQNPWWHQSPPYEVGRLYPYVDELYGRALIYFARKLQWTLNDTGRQTFDVMSYTLSPVAAVDPALVPDPDILQWRPGAKWPASPQAVRWHTLPDVHSAGFAAIRQLWEVLQESTGASTGGQYLPTLGVARGAETATGQSLLIAQSDIDINTVVTDIEESVLEPLCARIDSMEQQFLPSGTDRVLRALGRKGLPLLKEGMRIRREQLVGTRTYLWTGNSVSEQREKMQKQGPPFLEILAKLQGSPQGQIDLIAFAKNLYRSFGFQDADDIFQTTKPGQTIHFSTALEHAVMKSGHPIVPKLGEDYIAHLSDHNATLPMAQAEGWGDRLQLHMAQTIALAGDDPAFVQKLQGAAGTAPPPPGVSPPPQPGLPPAAPAPSPLLRVPPGPGNGGPMR